MENSIEDEAVSKDSDFSYYLNIASTENFGSFEWDEFSKSFLNRQLSIFMPIIQKFMADSMTDSFYFIENRELKR